MKCQFVIVSKWIEFKMCSLRNVIILLKQEKGFAKRVGKMEGPDILTKSGSNDDFGYYCLLPTPTLGVSVSM